jgi:hypothetical protein
MLIKKNGLSQSGKKEGNSLFNADCLLKGIDVLVGKSHFIKFLVEPVHDFAQP